MPCFDTSTACTTHDEDTQQLDEHHPSNSNENQLKREPDAESKRDKSKIVAIDGRAGTGKTTLGRFISWKFNGQGPAGT